MIYEHPSEGGIYVKKVPLLRTWTKDNPLTEFHEEIAPQATDSIIVKQYPSAFFGTNLAGNLRAIGVDTCIIIGCPTSGCIRASVLDGMQNGFRCIVPRECVGDRMESAHKSNLFDMNAKNGDVVTTNVVMDYLNGMDGAQVGSSSKIPRQELSTSNKSIEGEGVSETVGFGKRAAMIVIDFSYAYTSSGSPFLCDGKGFGVVDAVAESKGLIELARQKGVPIFYTKVFFEHPTDGGVFTQKIPLLRTWTKDNPLTEIHADIAPQATDSIIVKQYPSAFFGTNLASNLRAIGVDTCIIIGCSTSGCIRASVLDGMQHGFRCIIPRECVGDRTASVHESNLFDMNAKFGDVVPKAVVMDYLRAA